MQHARPGLPPVSCALLSTRSPVSAKELRSPPRPPRHAHGPVAGRPHVAPEWGRGVQASQPASPRLDWTWGFDDATTTILGRRAEQPAKPVHDVHSGANLPCLALPCLAPCGSQAVWQGPRSVLFS